MLPGACLPVRSQGQNGQNIQMEAVKPYRVYLSNHPVLSQNPISKGAFADPPACRVWVPPGARICVPASGSQPSFHLALTQSKQTEVKGDHCRRNIATEITGVEPHPRLRKGC